MLSIQEKRAVVHTGILWYFKKQKARKAAADRAGRSQSTKLQQKQAESGQIFPIYRVDSTLSGVKQVKYGPFR